MQLTCLLDVFTVFSSALILFQSSPVNQYKVSLSRPIFDRLICQVFNAVLNIQIVTTIYSQPVQLWTRYNNFGPVFCTKLSSSPKFSFGMICQTRCTLKSTSKEYFKEGRHFSFQRLSEISRAKIQRTWCQNKNRVQYRSVFLCPPHR